MFIWGGLISFRSVQSGEFRTPGLPPYWWAEGVLALTRDQNDKADFSEQDAMSWAAKEQQRGIDANCKENIERANALNASLRAGFVGAVMVCFAASFKIWPEVIAFAQKNF